MDTLTDSTQLAIYWVQNNCKNLRSEFEVHIACKEAAIRHALNATETTALLAAFNL